jgi:translation elongation factor EF-Tu-like GTPase
MSKTLVAAITFMDHAEGGRFTPPQSGFRPTIDVRGVKTSCTVESLEGTKVFEFRQTHKVCLTLMFPEQFDSPLIEGDEVALFEGNKLIGKGRVI